MSPGERTPGIAGESLGQAARVRVVLGEPLDHPGVAVPQGDEAGRGQHARLAHPAAEQLARPARPGDERASPTTTEPAGHARPFDRQNVTESAGAASSLADGRPARRRR